MPDQDSDQVMASDDIRSLVEQLKIRQAELENQNQELRQAQQELAVSRDRYSDLYDFAPVGYISLDCDGIIRDANLSAVDLLEINRRKLIGSEFSRFVGFTGQATWVQHHRNTITSVDKQVCEIPLRTALGDKLWVRIESVSVTDDDQNVTHVRTAVIDQTEYRRAQELIQEKDERLMAFLDNSDVLAWMKDDKGRYVFMSRNFLRRFHWKLADQLGKTDFELWPREIAEVFRRNDKLVLQRGCAVEALEEAIDPDGNSSWWSSHKFSFIDREENRFVGGMAVNVTEREDALNELKSLNTQLERRVAERTAEAEQRASELEVSEQRFRAVLDAVPDAIISMDDQGIIQGVNPAAEQIFGYQSREMIGENFTKLVPSFQIPSPANRDHAVDSVIRNETFAGEPLARKSDGQSFPIDIRTNALPQESLIVAIIRDVSTKKALEKQVIDSASDEQRRIGHDIHDGVGQELTGLRYMAQTHAESLDSQDSPEAKTAQRMCEWLDTIQRQMRGIIRKLVPVEVDQKGLIAALRGLAETTTELHPIDCVLECDDNLVAGDPRVANQLFRIIQEAVNNAVRHSQARLIQIRLNESDQMLDVQVVDDGTGIPTSVSRGNGIGMHTMAYRAGLINARLTVQPSSDGGTIVQCLIPIQTGASLFND